MAQERMRSRSTRGSREGGPGVRPGEAGFSLVVVFLILSVMAAAAMAILLTGRSGIRVAGHDRERGVAFYTAEAGLAYGKGELLGHWSPTQKWTPVLSNPAYRNGVTRDYKFGGTNGLPLIQARYTFWVRNNPDDTSGSPTVDGDGRLVILARGDALDPSGQRILATVTVQTEVEYVSSGTGTMDYMGQQNQDASGSLRASPDTNAVDMSHSTRL